MKAPVRITRLGSRADVEPAMTGLLAPVLEREWAERYAGPRPSRRNWAENIAPYRHDPCGRMVVSVQKVPTIVSCLEGHGYTVEVVDFEPAHPHLHRFPFGLGEIMPEGPALAAAFNREARGQVRFPGDRELLPALELLVRLFPAALVNVVCETQDEAAGLLRALEPRLNRTVELARGPGWGRGRVQVGTVDALKSLDPDIIAVADARDVGRLRPLLLLPDLESRKLFGFTRERHSRAAHLQRDWERFFGPVLVRLWPSSGGDDARGPQVGTVDNEPEDGEFDDE